MPSNASDTHANALVCLLGPTGSGKSAVAVDIAVQLPVEIISVDSALIYKGMDIGTAKPNRQLRARIPHHLIDIIEPSCYYSAAQFREAALTAIEQIRQRQRIPLLVGGTMFYFKVLQHGLSPMPESHPETRAKLSAHYKTSEALHEKLQRVDPKAAARIHAQDRQRVLRALSVYYDGGQTLSSYQKPESMTALTETIRYVALDYDDRAQLHRRIEQRYHTMLQQGLLDEVAQLMLRGDLDAESPSMRAIAYRQAWQYLLGHCDYPAMVSAALAASRQFAKRQLTWMRRMPIASRYAVDAIPLKQIASCIMNQDLECAE